MKNFDTKGFDMKIKKGATRVAPHLFNQLQN